MKKVLFITALLLSTPALAEDNGLDCESISTLAGKIMEVRQAGYPMSKIRADLEAVWHPMITDAYRETRWSTDSRKQREIEKFTNKYALACYEYADK